MFFFKKDNSHIEKNPELKSKTVWSIMMQTILKWTFSLYLHFTKVISMLSGCTLTIQLLLFMLMGFCGWWICFSSMPGGKKERKYSHDSMDDKTPVAGSFRHKIT